MHIDSPRYICAHYHNSLSFSSAAAPGWPFYACDNHVAFLCMAGTWLPKENDYLGIPRLLSIINQRTLPVLGYELSRDKQFLNIGCHITEIRNERNALLLSKWHQQLPCKHSQRGPIHDLYGQALKHNRSCTGTLIDPLRMHIGPV